MKTNSYISMSELVPLTCIWKYQVTHERSQRWGRCASSEDDSLWWGTVLQLLFDFQGWKFRSAFKLKDQPDLYIISIYLLTPFSFNFTTCSDNITYYIIQYTKTVSLFHILSKSFIQLSIELKSHLLLLLWIQCCSWVSSRCWVSSSPSSCSCGW